MPEDWFYLVDGVRTGPVERLDLEKLLGTRSIPPDALVWGPGVSDWTAGSAVFPSAAELVLPVTGDHGADTALPSSKKATWLLAWQILTLLLIVPYSFGPRIMEALTKFPPLGGEGPVGSWIFDGVFVIGFLLNLFFVIAMFWKRRWAVWGFVMVSMVQIVFASIFATRLSLSGFGVFGAMLAWAAVFPFVLSVGTLFLALRLGRDASNWAWSHERP